MICLGWIILVYNMQQVSEGDLTLQSPQQQRLPNLQRLEIDSKVY